MSEDDLGDRAATCLSCQIAFDDGTGLQHPGHFYGGAVGEDDNGQFELDRAHCFDQRIMLRVAGAYSIGRSLPIR